jgi:hypothetical protein
MRRRGKALSSLAVAASIALLGLLVGGNAAAHQSGCHSAHTCPSDHHSYVWYDSAGNGWDCVQPGAPEYDPSSDTSTISYDGRTYYCRAAGSAPAPAPQPTPTPAPTPTPIPSGPLCKLGAHPDTSCTPGATFHVSARKVCERGYSKRVRNVPTSTKNKVYDEYGVTSHAPGEYEIDHLISLELGGSNSTDNLWPEKQPGARSKDKYENELHRQVCDGTISLKAAQRRIVRWWHYT